MLSKISDGTMTVLRIFVVTLTAAMGAAAAQPSSLSGRIQAVMGRPEFAHSVFGFEFYSLDSGELTYQLNPNQLFVPGSTTKLVTEGTALELLGSDYRFHTRVYRTGAIDKDGTLEGDLVLVASGDPNLSGRIQPDDTLAYENEDHSYGGPDSKGVGTDPLLVVHQLADQIAGKGIKRIRGHVLVDISLFPEGAHELGTGIVISPIVINDNVIDVIPSPGAAEGAPVNLQISPRTSYVQFINKAVTGKPDSKPSIDYADDKTNPDGTHTVTIIGSIPLGKTFGMMAYAVPEPSRFAITVLSEALRERGVAAPIPEPGAAPDFKALSAKYTPEDIMAEHVSPPLKEEVKVTLKVSQNLHASMTPFLLGALIAHKNQNVEQAGFNVEHDFLKSAGLDLTAASQTDGAGGNAFFTPDFMVSYLRFMSKQKNFADFHRALPILGRDGTLFKIQVNSPAAGHVFAKTGTYAVFDALNNNLMVTGKGLAGYMETTAGRHLAFAIYVNNVAVSKDDPQAAQKVAGEALGEIAAAAYDAPLGSESQSKSSR